MSCGICNKNFDSRRKPSCASCTKAKLYGQRIEQAASLLSREKAHTHAEAVLRPGNDGILAALPEDADWDAIASAVKTNSAQRAREEREAVEERIRDIAVKADRLREEIEAYKGLIASRKEANASRGERLNAEHVRLDKDKARVSEPIKSAVVKARHRLNKIHTRTIEAREYLCQEAGVLSGLKKTKLPDGRSQFVLRGLPIPNLRELNGMTKRLKSESISSGSEHKEVLAPHELISGSIDSICRFLGLCCHYLSIRLPAEIIQPHHDFPHPAVLPINSSYKPRLPCYPGFRPPEAEVVPPTEGSRPRVLQMDRPLPQMLKEDSKTAQLFIEGVSLLAYDIAWLCRTQGTGSLNEFEEICDIGRNLHQLFPNRDGKGRPALNRNLSSATTKPDRSVAETDGGQPRFGSYSHGSSRNSLAGSQAEDQFPEWKLSITKFVDQLKALLRNEAARAEWHIIDDTEWDEQMEHEKPVLVGGFKRSPAMSVMTIKPSDGDDEFMDARNTSAAAKGGSGWTKVRGRGGDV
jgi:hypothetical protein